MNVETIKNKINILPPNLQREVVDYIDFLTNKYQHSSKDQRFKFDWEGGLSDLKDKCSSVELQHKAMEWR